MCFISSRFLIISLFIVVFHEKLTQVTGNPKKGVIKQLLQMSYQQCVTACEETLNCVSAKHIRLSALCILYDQVFDGVLGPGVMKYIKPNKDGDMAIQECVINEKCIDSCGEPITIPGTEILGNMVSVGAKVRYRCIDGSNSVISECLSNGNWSMINLTCTCSRSNLLSSQTFWTSNRTTRKNANKETELVFRVGENTVVCIGNWKNESFCDFLCGENEPGCEQFDDYCLYFGKESVTWEQALNKCQNINGNLVEIGSKMKNDFIFNITKGRTWIGASKSRSSEKMEMEKKWIWAGTNRTFLNVYTNWNVSEPSGDGNCVQINKYGKWNDANCSHSLLYVCDIT